MSADDAYALAEIIADDLLTNGQGQEAEQLRLSQKDGSIYLGGWCKNAVIDVIRKQLEVRA